MREQMSDEDHVKPIWGGRFSDPMDAQVRKYTASLPVDCRLAPQDIRGSIAHTRMLDKCGIIADNEAQQIIEGLQQILADLECGSLSLDTAPSGAADDEDIHSFVERVLTERIGAVAGKLHTARSRNDQVATDLRMWTKEAIRNTQHATRELQTTFVDLAGRHLNDPMPGYTHLQRAQPVLLSHHLLAYFWMLQRDYERLEDCHHRTNVLPLGSAALAGTTFPIDRDMVAKELGFDRVSENSMDAVSDRDFAVEFVFDLALLMTHLSRLCEELILWSSSEFGFVEFADAFATGSSIMPQKKNPDVAEIARGKSSKVIGDLVSLLTLLKGLPLTYNRDLQEDKAAVFSAYDTAADTLSVLNGALGSLTFNTERMRQCATEGYSLATDLADALARHGVPFREAHEVVGKIVRQCVEQQRDLESLSLDDLRAFHADFGQTIVDTLNLSASLAARESVGATSPRAVEQQLERAKSVLSPTQ